MGCYTPLVIVSMRFESIQYHTIMPNLLEILELDEFFSLPAFAFYQGACA